MRRFVAAAACRRAFLPIVLAVALPGGALGQPPARPPAKPPATAAQPAPAPKPAPKTGGPSQRAVAAAGNAPYTGDLDGMIKRRVIRVGTAYNRTHYFIDKGVQRGIAYEAFKLFEDELNTTRKTGNLRVHVVMVPMSREEMLPALTAGRVDVVAAGLTVTDARKQTVDFSEPTVSNVDEVLVSGPGAPAIASPDALSGQTLFLRKSSSYYDSVQRLNAKLKAAGKPPVVVKEAPETLEDEDILEMVNAGLVKLTIVDSYLATFWKQLMPQIEIHPDVAVATGGTLAVAMRKNSPQMHAAIAAWIKRHGAKTMFGNMMVKRYLRSTTLAKSATGGAEMARFKQVVDLFRKYGDQYQLDAVLMAAQGFQESGLDQNAKSHVGAVGVMQVMPATGKDLNVGDIHQIEPNIHAGVKYIRFMIDTYFADEPMDRLNKGLFAFASYNAGPGRVRQLRREAERQGLDPNVWFNNVERIASQRVGRETVQYVSNIYKYYVAYRLALDEQAEKEKARTAPSPPSQ
jgi:membrane-bound lytic murein transglycosylase MltF